MGLLRRTGVPHPVLFALVLFLTPLSLSAAPSRVATGRAALSRAIWGFFVKNEGQFPRGIAFRARASGRFVDLTEGGILFRFLDPSTGEVVSVPMELPGSRRVAPVGMRRLRSDVVYHIPGGNFRAGTYGEVLYRDIYPGVDLVFRVVSGALEYEFRLAPGVDPGVIEVLYRGSRVRVSGDGDSIEVSLPGFSFKDREIHAYQVEDGERKVLPARFRPTSAGGFSFSVEGRDPRLPLIIDPFSLGFASYIGENNSNIEDSSDGIYAVASDGHGYVAAAGYITRLGSFVECVEDEDWCGCDDHSELRTNRDAVVYILERSGSSFSLSKTVVVGGLGEDGATAVSLSDGYLAVGGWTEKTYYWWSCSSPPGCGSPCSCDMPFNHQYTSEDGSTHGTDFCSGDYSSGTIAPFIARYTVGRDEDGSIEEIPEDSGMVFMIPVNPYPLTEGGPLGWGRVESIHVDGDGTIHAAGEASGGYGWFPYRRRLADSVEFAYSKEKPHGFLVRFDGEGNLVYATLLGGGSGQFVHGLSVAGDTSWIAGSTGPGLPTTDGSSCDGLSGFLSGIRFEEGALKRFYSTATCDYPTFRGLALSRDGGAVWACGYDGSVWRFEREEGEDGDLWGGSRLLICEGAHLFGCAISGDGSRLYVVGETPTPSSFNQRFGSPSGDSAVIGLVDLTESPPEPVLAAVGGSGDDRLLSVTVLGEGQEEVAVAGGRTSSGDAYTENPIYGEKNGHQDGYLVSFSFTRPVPGEPRELHPEGGATTSRRPILTWSYTLSEGVSIASTTFHIHVGEATFDVAGGDACSCHGDECSCGFEVRSCNALSANTSYEWYVVAEVEGESSESLHASFRTQDLVLDGPEDGASFTPGSSIGFSWRVDPCLSTSCGSVHWEGDGSSGAVDGSGEEGDDGFLHCTAAGTFSDLGSYTWHVEAGGGQSGSRHFTVSSEGSATIKHNGSGVTEWDFGDVAVGSCREETFTVEGEGISSWGSCSSSSDEFEVTGCGQTLKVRFCPKSGEGEKSATVTVNYTQGGSQVHSTLHVRGSALCRVDVEGMRFESSSCTYGDISYHGFAGLSGWTFGSDVEIYQLGEDGESYRVLGATAPACLVNGEFGDLSGNYFWTSGSLYSCLEGGGCDPVSNLIGVAPDLSVGPCSDDERGEARLCARLSFNSEAFNIAEDIADDLLVGFEAHIDRILVKRKNGSEYLTLVGSLKTPDIVAQFFRDLEIQLSELGIDDQGPYLQGASLSFKPNVSMRRLPVKIKQVEFELSGDGRSTSQLKFGGEVEVKKLVDVSGDLSFVLGGDLPKLNGVHLSASVPCSRGIPVGNTGVKLTGLGGGIEGFVKDPLIISADASFCGGPPLPSPLEDASLICMDEVGVEIDPASYVTVSGSLGLICDLPEVEESEGGLLGVSFEGGINWQEKRLWGSGTVTYPLNVVEGTLSASIGVDDQGDPYISGGVQGKINIPGNVPVIGGYSIGQAGVYVNNDGLWGEGSISLVVLDLSVACHIPWDAAVCSDASCLWDKVSCGDNLESIGYGTALSSPDPYRDSGAVEARFTVERGTGGLVATVQFDFPQEGHSFYLVSPSGTRLTPDVPQGASYGYGEGNHNATYMVKDPEPGTWYADFSGFRNPRFHVYSFNGKPDATVRVISSDLVEEVPESAASVDAREWVEGEVCVQDPDGDGVDVSIFYTNRVPDSGFPAGSRVARFSMGSGECRRFGARLSDLPPGNYRLYAAVTDGKNVPKVVYAPVTVQVVKDWDIPDPGLSVVYNDKIKGVTLSWHEIPGVEGYRVYVSEDGGETWTDTPAATGATTYDLPYLKPGKSYLFAVTGYDFPDEFVESNMSSPVSFTMPDIPIGSIRLTSQGVSVSSISPPPFGEGSEPYEGIFCILNKGDGALKVEAVTLRAHGPAAQSVRLDLPRDLPVDLDPQGTLCIGYTVDPRPLFESGRRSLRASLTVRSSDPKRRVLSVPVVVTRAHPGLVIFPRSLEGGRSVDFGKVSVGHEGRYTVALENVGNVPLALNLSFAGGEGFSASPQTVSLEPGEMRKVELSFSPESGGCRIRTLVISDSRWGFSKELSVKGCGTMERPVMDRCSPESAVAAVGEEAAFSCNAHDPDGEVVGYYVEFGDGEKGVFESGYITHTYSTPGIYVVRVYPVDNTDNTGTPGVVKVKVCPAEDLEASRVIFPKVLRRFREADRPTTLALVYYDTLTEEGQEVDHYHVAVLVDGEEVGRTSVPIRGKGRSFRTVRFLRFRLDLGDLALGPGRHTVTVVLDPEGLVREEDRRNNRVDFSFSVE